MAVLSHWQLPAFRGLHLEDSAVFAIRETPGELCFEMELVIGERHPSYRAPRGDDPRCYRRGRLVFRGVSQLDWAVKRIDTDKPAASGDPGGDCGTIDSFVLDGSDYKLRGAWGQVSLRATSVDVSVW